MSPALEAAFRLATTLPKRTHLRPTPEKRYPVPGMVTEAKKRHMRELAALGWSRKRISAEVRVGGSTVMLVLGRRKPVRKKRIAA